MAWLFDCIASSWGCQPIPEQGLFHGLRSYAVDGVAWSLPDTSRNCEEFGRQSNNTATGAWPRLRAACLMNTYTHLIRAAEFGDYRLGELSLVKPLMQAVPDDSLTIFDRAYFSAALLLDWQQAGKERHWLMRLRTSLRHEVIHQFAPGDFLVRMPVSPKPASNGRSCPRTGKPA